MLDLEPWRVRRLASAGLVDPDRGSQGEFRFAFVDMVVLRAARDLLAEGVPFRRVRRAFARLSDALPDDRSITQLRLDADNHRVVVREEDVIWDAESRQMLLDFQLHELAAALQPLVTPRAVPPPVPAALDAAHWFELGCELELTCAEEARAAYRRAVEADPSHVDAHVNLGRLLHEQGNVEAARDHYHRALDLRPSDLTARFNLGVALEDLNRLPEACRAYRETILADPDHADAHFNLAGVLERTGHRNQALRHLKAYRRLTGAAGSGSD